MVGQTRGSLAGKNGKNKRENGGFRGKERGVE